jgi:methionyl-tRNA formyltransferase
MRIEFLTQNDPIYILPFFVEFLRHYSGEFEILKVSCSPAMGKRDRIQMVRELTQLYGFVGFARLATERLWKLAVSRLPKGQNAKTFSSIRQLCRTFSIAYEDIGNPNAASYLEGVRIRKPELIASVACPYILKEDVLKSAPRGCVNIHHAPLPRYKGMMPSFWQMFQGERTVGVTVHLMGDKVDEGEAILQEQMAIEDGESLDHLIRKSKRHGAHVMAKALRLMASGEARPFSLNSSPGTYFTFPTAGEISEFKQRGYRAI